MFKLMTFFALVAVATAKPGGLYTSPYVAGSLINEQTIESHGNAVVHASAPVVSAVPTVHVAAVKASPLVYQAVYQPVHHHLVAEKSVSSHGHSVVHHQPAFVPAVYAAPAYHL